MLRRRFGNRRRRLPRSRQTAYTRAQEDCAVLDTKVISLGGSIIAPDGVDVPFLRELRQTLVEYLEEDPERRLILVCGGGGPAREYQRAYREVLASVGPSAAGPPAPEADAQDWIGIAATRLNAELLRQLLAPFCGERVVTDPVEVSVFPGRVLVGAGWKPGFSTDYDAVLLAEKFQAGTLLNLSNIPQVYEADPRTHPQARPLERMRWAELQQLVGREWTPGQNAPFDPVATAYAAKIALTVVVAAGRDIANLKAILSGESFTGTVIGPQ
ncbi:MAG: UMP kinase [Spirochaetales bacterium]|nr:UMP kinase [Spirochaetales bacterium]